MKSSARGREAHPFKAGNKPAMNKTPNLSDEASRLSVKAIIIESEVLI